MAPWAPKSSIVRLDTCKATTEASPIVEKAEIKVHKEMSEHFKFCNMCARDFLFPVNIVYGFDSAKSLIEIMHKVYQDHGVGCPINVANFNNEWLDELMNEFPRYNFTKYISTYTVRRKCNHDPKYHGNPQDSASRGLEMKWLPMM
jgi:hypothetical protein